MQMKHSRSPIHDRHRLFAGGCVLLVLALIAATGPATAPATLPALGDGDRAILHRLEAGTWRERRSAEQELAGWAPDQEPTIQAMLVATTSPEAKARLQAVVLRMAEQRLVGTSIISMHVKDAPAKAVYSDLFQQAYATLDTDPANLLDDPSLPKLTLDLNHVPFWTVEQQLAASSHLGMSMGPAGTYVLRRGVAIEPGPQVISGPLLLILGHPAIDQGQNYGRVNVIVCGEPKVRVLLMGPQLKVDQAIDNHGNALTLDGRAQSMGTGTGELCMSMVLHPANKDPGDYLTRFRATLSVPVALHPQHLTIDDVMHAAPRDIHVGDLTVTFEGCKKANGWYVATFSCSGADAQVRLNQLLQEPIGHVQALDAHGNVVFSTGRSYSTNQTGNNVTSCTLGYMYTDRGAEPKKLICDVPTEMKTIDVPMDFKDINYQISKGR